MRKIIAAVLSVVALAIGGATLNAPAALAAPQSPQVAQAVTAVPPITCEYEDSCVQGYFPNEGNGYHMLRRADGTKWVRTTMVPGWDNSFVAPITCKWYSWCVYDYYGPGHYWMARQAPGGTTWVKLSQ